MKRRVIKREKWDNDTTYYESYDGVDEYISYTIGRSIAKVIWFCIKWTLFFPIALYVAIWKHVGNIGKTILFIFALAILVLFSTVGTEDTTTSLPPLSSYEYSEDKQVNEMISYYNYNVDNNTISEDMVTCIPTQDGDYRSIIQFEECALYVDHVEGDPVISFAYNEDYSDSAMPVIANAIIACKHIRQEDDDFSPSTVIDSLISLDETGTYILGTHWYKVDHYDTHFYGEYDYIIKCTRL